MHVWYRPPLPNASPLPTNRISTTPLSQPALGDRGEPCADQIGCPMAERDRRYELVVEPACADIEGVVIKKFRRVQRVGRGMLEAGRAWSHGPVGDASRRSTGSSRRYG